MIFLQTHCANVGRKINITSYDRMFPNQDFVPKDGIGNLIALPLQYYAYKDRRSGFINESGQLIHNPIAYLSFLRKLTEYEMDTILSQNLNEQEFFFESNQIMMPLGIDKRISKVLHIKEDSMLHIDKTTCNPYTLLILKRIASMQNPEYRKMARLHRSIHNIPYVISETIETDQVLSLPRGCMDKISSICQGTEIHHKDDTCFGDEIDVSFQGELYEMQQEAVKVLLRYDTGMLHAAAGYGKTVMALYILAKKKCSTLIIVPKKDLLKQWRKEIDTFLVYPKAMKKKDDYIGEYSGSKKKLKGNIDVATIQSLVKLEHVDELLDRYGCIIIDECHHIPSDSFRQVMRQVRAHYIYGFSATPEREDGLEKIIYMYCGEKRYEINKKQVIMKRTFRQILIPHFTSIQLFEEKETYQEVIDELYVNEHRNFFIANDIIGEFKKGRKSIVLSERIEHLYILYEKIRDVSPNIFVLTSEMKTSQRKQAMDEIAEVSKTQPYIVLATSRLLGEGFNLPSLDTLFLTLPISDKNRIAQYTGRIHRECRGKLEVYVHDYIDIHIPMMETMFQKRMRAYQSEGYFTETKEHDYEVVKYIFDRDTFSSKLQEDFETAKKQVLIFMNDYTFGKIKQYFSLLQNTIRRGIMITFIINEDTKVDENTRKYMIGCGADIKQVCYHRKINCLIFDRNLIWYGDLNVFGRCNQEASLIRLDNQMLIEEMLETIKQSQKETKNEGIFALE